MPLTPSEEHLPLDSTEKMRMPQVGEALYLLPRHVCPTVNNFDFALLVRDSQIVSVEKVSARGREAPLLRTSEWTISGVRPAAPEKSSQGRFRNTGGPSVRRHLFDLPLLASAAHFLL